MLVLGLVRTAPLIVLIDIGVKDRKVNVLCNLDF